ncbi:hypothetical protein [Methylobacterium dankookense]|uniref:Uncharacterized protein n=1 Tax=Methylobacterium dankookense TaxID=560405 RepID=A0A564FT88_9HYPH|nr:hypothetical protein [Methylobacterium dankookense]GJD55864.1 hypothetical protein IFDJLNFL_1755 [Methylobacterium dankookense]VUF10641.1 hypothetical protein MTDSW087_00309 [Methylobacterium dankookense]
MRGTRAILAGVPLAAALLAVLAVAVTGLSQRSALPPALEPYAYGFFLDRYPLFAFALVYGLARILAAAAMPGPASPARRVVFAGLGLVLLLAAALHPTFGGLVLRGGFMAGGSAFLTGQPIGLAYAIGAAVAALVFGLAIGLPSWLGRAQVRRAGFWRRARGLAATATLSFLALWLAAALIGLGRDLGIGPWPRRTFTPEEALRAALVLLVAGLPHTLVIAFRSVGPAPAGRDRLPLGMPLPAR